MPVELIGQHMTFLNGGPAHALTRAFFYSVACKDQADIDRYWDNLLAAASLIGCWARNAKKKLNLPW